MPIRSAWALLVATGLFACTGVATHPYPVGVSFGQGNISAALIQESGEPLLIANIAATDTYRQMMWDSVEYEGAQFEMNDRWYLAREDGDPIPINKPGNEQIMTATFRENLKNIRNTITQKIGYKMNISSIVYPRHLNNTALNLLERVAVQDEEAIILHDQIRSFYDGALMAYDFQPGYGLAMIVDLDDEYMDYAFGSIAQYCGYNVSELNIRMRGMSRVRGASKIGEGDEQVNEFWDGVREEYASEWVAVSILENIKKFKVVVLAGEAPSEALSRLRQAVVSSAGPEHDYQVYDSVDPRFAAAVGAAKWAKFQVEHEDTFFVSEGCPSTHDEL